MVRRIDNMALPRHNFFDAPNDDREKFVSDRQCRCAAVDDDALVRQANTLMIMVRVMYLARLVRLEWGSSLSTTTDDGHGH